MFLVLKILILIVFRVAVQGGFGLDTAPILRWGLGAIIIMLIVSTAISLGKKFLPLISKLIPEEELDTARSLEQMTSLAQYAYEAFEKYQALNSKEEN